MPSISNRLEREPPARLVEFGRIIESELALPGAVPADELGDPAELRIRLLPAEPAPAAPEPLYRLEHGRLIFSVADVATYHCRADGIDVAPRRGADPRDVTALLIATALPAVLWCRGEFVLHAAGVLFPGHDGVLAIAGPSGIGKSTLTAALIARGATLVADDTICVGAAPDGPVASGLAGGYHLAAADGERRILHPVAPSRSSRSATLGAVIVLSRSEGPPELTRLEPVEGVTQLLDNQHRPRIPALIGRRAEVLRFCAYLSRAVPVYSWRRARGGIELGAGEWDLLTSCLLG